MPALSLQLQQPIVVAHDPVVRDRARLLETKHRVEPQPARRARWKSSGETGARAKRALWSAQYAVSRNALAVARSAIPLRRSFFTRRSCCVP